MHLSPLLLVAFAAGLIRAPLPAQGFYKRLPNDYLRTADDNAATRLDARLASGEIELPMTGRSGRLLALLRALDVPVSSQTLVFSKTSKQRHRVSPHNPRALYFHRDAYVGYIPGAESIELIVGDDRLGLAFYRVPQGDDAPVRIIRDDTCLSCHASARTHDEPGLLLRSVFPDENGDPIASAGETQMDFRSPIVERWGGWLVTGTFRGQHRGNGIATRGEFDSEWHVTSRPAEDLRAFADQFDVGAYPVATSDI
ncbi:MAG TPA: hypothetical protein ENI87_08480, partial [bacterium]|nr:hypothetical protein [bacterium]